jgi:ligand-binding sensor domain-containing protein
MLKKEKYFRNKMKLRFSILLILFISTRHFLLGQSISSAYYNYSTSDGLPSSEVYDVIKDHRGYMWFATDNGISRFDGYEFKNYGPKQGLIDPVVFDLEEDKHGRIWTASLKKNLFYLDSKRDSVINLSHLSNSLSGCREIFCGALAILKIKKEFIKLLFNIL